MLNVDGFQFSDQAVIVYRFNHRVVNQGQQLFCYNQYTFPSL